MGSGGKSVKLSFGIYKDLPDDHSYQLKVKHPIIAIGWLGVLPRQSVEKMEKQEGNGLVPHYVFHLLRKAFVCGRFRELVKNSKSRDLTQKCSKPQ